ncbi:MAG: hypothetical protein ACR2IF_01185 [Terriglobales bacterium]
MRPTGKPDPYGRGRQQPGYGQNRSTYGGYGQQTGYGQQQPGYGQQRPGYGQPPQKPPEQKKPEAPLNIRADVVWALRGAGGGLSVFDISSKLADARKPRYAETKIVHILETMVQDGKVTKSEETGRVTYKWAVEAV